MGVWPKRKRFQIVQNCRYWFGIDIDIDDYIDLRYCNMILIWDIAMLYSRLNQLYYICVDYGPQENMLVDGISP